MATTSAPASTGDIGALITRTPGVQGGRPCVAGTGISVMRIAGWYNMGWIPEEIARRLDLGLAEVHAAITYYHANQPEIEADIAEEQALYEQYSKEQRARQNEGRA